MVPLQDLVKVPHVEVGIPLSIEPQHPFDGRHRHPLGTRAPRPAVIQPIVAVLLIARAPPPHGPGRPPQNLGRLDLRELAAHRS